jgi:hypothetical protein
VYRGDTGREGSGHGASLVLGCGLVPSSQRRVRELVRVECSRTSPPVGRTRGHQCPRNSSTFRPTPKSNQHRSNWSAGSIVRCSSQASPTCSCKAVSRPSLTAVSCTRCAVVSSWERSSTQCKTPPSLPSVSVSCRKSPTHHGISPHLASPSRCSRRQLASSSALSCNACRMNIDVYLFTPTVRCSTRAPTGTERSSSAGQSSLASCCTTVE